MFEIIKKISLHSVLYALGDFLVMGFGIILVPFYTIYLQPSDYGIINYLLAVNSVLLPLISLSIFPIISLKYFDFKTHEQFKRFFSTIFYFGAGLSVVLLGLLLGVEYFFPLLSTSEIPFYPLLFLSVGSCFFTQFVQIPLRVFNCQERPLSYSFYNIANFLIGISLLIFYIAILKEGVLGNVKAFLLRDVFMFLIALGFSKHYLVLEFSGKLLKQALILSLPLIPHTFSSAALTLLDRILLARLGSLESVGLYSLSYQVSSILAIIGSAIGMSLYPLFFKLHKADDPGASTLSARLFTLAIYAFLFITLGLIFFAREAIFLLAESRYHSSYQIVPILAAGMFLYFLYFLANIPVSYLKKTGLLFLASLSAAVLNFLLNWWWIPQWDQAGAAYATTVSYAWMFGVLFLFVRKWMPLPMPKIHLLGACLLAISIASINLFWLENYDISVLNVVAKCATLSLFPLSLIAFKWVDVSELKRSLLALKKSRS